MRAHTSLYCMFIIQTSLTFLITWLTSSLPDKLQQHTLAQAPPGCNAFSPHEVSVITCSLLHFFFFFFVAQPSYPPPNRLLFVNSASPRENAAAIWQLVWEAPYVWAGEGPRSSGPGNQPRREQGWFQGPHERLRGRYTPSGTCWFRWEDMCWRRDTGGEGESEWR